MSSGRGWRGGGENGDPDVSDDDIRDAAGGDQLE